MWQAWLVMARRHRRGRVRSGGVRRSGLAGRWLAGQRWRLRWGLMVPAFSLVSVLLIFGAAGLSLTLYRRAAPESSMMDGPIGARIGLTTGLLLLAALTADAGGGLGMMARFRLHAMGVFDAQWALQVQVLTERAVGDGAGRRTGPGAGGDCRSDDGAAGVSGVVDAGECGAAGGAVAGVDDGVWGGGGVAGAGDGAEGGVGRRGAIGGEVTAMNRAQLTDGEWERRCGVTLREKSRLMSASEIERTLVRLAHEIVEKNEGAANVSG